MWRTPVSALYGGALLLDRRREHVRSSSGYDRFGVEKLAEVTHDEVLIVARRAASMAAAALERYTDPPASLSILA
jgi:hypothetical protein